MKTFLNGLIKAGKQILEFFIGIFLDMSRGFRNESSLNNSHVKYYKEMEDPYNYYPENFKNKLD